MKCLRFQGSVSTVVSLLRRQYGLAEDHLFLEDIGFFLFFF